MEWCGWVYQYDKDMGRILMNYRKVPGTSNNTFCDLKNGTKCFSYIFGAYLVQTILISDKRVQRRSEQNLSQMKSFLQSIIERYGPGSISTRTSSLLMCFCPSHSIDVAIHMDIPWKPKASFSTTYRHIFQYFSSFFLNIEKSAKKIKSVL